jgi:hypothetical protein
LNLTDLKKPFDAGHPESDFLFVKINQDKTGWFSGQSWNLMNLKNRDKAIGPIQLFKRFCQIVFPLPILPNLAETASFSSVLFEAD